MRPAIPVVLATAGWLAWWGLSPTGRHDPPPPADLGTAAAPTRETRPPGHRTITGDWRALLGTPAEDPEVRRRELADAKKRWLDEDLQVVARTVAQLLRSGDDAETGIPFETGPGGALRGWPTLRVFLLDVLAASDPDLAMEIAREVLATTTSADEFAVALKPLVLGGPWLAPPAELEAHFSRLLGNPEWQRSAGLAEALDLARLHPTPPMLETLARWVDAAPAAREAGIQALHESAARLPALTLDLLSAHPDLFAAQADLRASLMARADISVPGQADQVERYLRDPAVPLAEKQQFLGLFPLRSATTGYRLYGKPPAPFTAGEVRAGDRAALGLASQWKTDPDLAGLAADTAALERRLQSWVSQAGD